MILGLAGECVWPGGGVLEIGPRQKGRHTMREGNGVKNVHSRKSEPPGLSVFLRLFDAQNTAPNVEVALRIGDLDLSLPQLLLDREIQIALEPAGTVAHFAAPDHELEIDGALAEFLQENT